MNENNDILMADMFAGSSSEILSVINRLVFIDIGTIVRIKADGKAVVKSHKLLNNKAIEYSSVEVIYPGNKGGAYASDVENCPCIIFVPQQCVPNIDNTKVRNSVNIYSKDGIKAMPISTGKQSTVNTFFSGQGFNITNNNYQVSFNKDNITITYGDIRLMLNGDKEITIDKYDATNQKWTKYKLEAAGLEITGPNDLLFRTRTDGKITLNGDDDSIVTYIELNEALQAMWSAIKNHTHDIKNTFELTAGVIPVEGAIQSIDQGASWGTYEGLDISKSESQTVKTLSYSEPGPGPGPTPSVRGGLLTENNHLMLTETGRPLLTENAPAGTEGTKISGLPSASSISDNSVFVIVQGGVTEKVPNSVIKDQFDQIDDASVSSTATWSSSKINTALSGKLGTGDNAISASKLQTARSISLTGDASGSASFDGSADISINTNVSHADSATTALTAGVAGTSASWTSPITLSLSGDASGSVLFDGTQDVSMSVSVEGGVVELTQAEYDALTQEEKEDGRVRVISDSDEAQILAETVFGLVHPIGEVYVQYPNQKTPNELWGQFSTWTEITSDYAGLFFRAEGGNSAAFGTEQADAIKTHTTTSQSTSTTSTNGGHSHTAASYTGQVGWQGTSSWSYLSNNAGSYVTGYNPATSTNGSHSHTLAHTHTYTGEVETRPVNTAIKLWRRTA